MRIDNMMPFIPNYKKGNAIKTATQNHVAGKSNHDTLTISAKTLQNSAEAVTNTGKVKAVQEQTPVAHKERVERIKVDIQNGTYSVANDLVADAIVRRAGEGRHQ